jgi:F1F0 ATPase subunit 2
MMILINFGDTLWASSAFAILIGMLLGVFYFAGLWWTVRQLSSSPSVALLFLVSMLVRTGIVMGGFYVFLGSDWRHLLLGLLGFIAVRLFATRFIKSKDNVSVMLKPEFITQEGKQNEP